MRMLTIMALIVLLIAGLAYGKEYEVKKKAGEYTVDVKIDKNPPVTGANNMDIDIKDAAGKAVKDAKVVVEYGMAAMPGMPAMNYKTDAEPKGEKYKAVMNLSMAGPWNIAIRITKGPKTETARFTVDAK